MDERLTKMACEAGIPERDVNWWSEELEAFARAVAEDCAKVCESEYDEYADYQTSPNGCARAIRARYP